MKKNLFALSAILIAVFMCSFTKKPYYVDVYMMFTGGVEKEHANYSQEESYPGEYDNIGTLTLVWARFLDDDGTVHLSEFDAEFEALDWTSSGVDKLSDETEDHATIELQ